MIVYLKIQIKFHITNYKSTTMKEEKRAKSIISLVVIFTGARVA